MKLTLLRSILGGSIVAAATSSPAALATGASEEAAREDPLHARPRLVVEHESVKAGGETAIAVTFDIDSEWHLYWPGVNDTGGPVLIEWDLPTGVTIGEAQWPAPKRHLQRFDSLSILDHIYEDRLTILFPLRVDAGAGSGGPLEIKADLEWLVCSEACVFEFRSVSTSIALASTDASERSEDAGIFDEARRRLPRQVDDARQGVRIAREGHVIAIDVKDAERLAFYPRDGELRFVDLARDGEAQSSTLRLELREIPSEGDLLTGVLEVWSSDKPKGSVLFDLRTPMSGAKAP